MDTFAYLDNVTLAWRSREEHDFRLMRFLWRFVGTTLPQMRTKPSPLCRIQILGYVVGNGIVKPDPDRLSALNEFPPPQCRKSLRRSRNHGRPQKFFQGRATSTFCLCFSKLLTMQYKWTLTKRFTLHTSQIQCPMFMGVGRGARRAKSPLDFKI